MWHIDRYERVSGHSGSHWHPDPHHRLHPGRSNSDVGRGGRASHDGRARNVRGRDGRRCCTPRLPNRLGQEQHVMSTLPAELRQVLDRWVAAELAGDAAALGAVLHPQFLFAGPFGYLLDREQWLGRFTARGRYHTVFTSFALPADIPLPLARYTALAGRSPPQTGT